MTDNVQSVFNDFDPAHESLLTGEQIDLSLFILYCGKDWAGNEVPNTILLFLLIILIWSIIPNESSFYNNNLDLLLSLMLLIKFIFF